MKQQHHIDAILDNGDGSYTFQIGPYTVQKTAEWLFDRSAFSEVHMRKNLQLAYHVGAKPDIASQEYLNSVNATIKGMDLGDSQWFIKWIRVKDLNQGTYDVNFSQSRTPGDGPYTIEVSREQIEEEPTGRPEDILWNVRSFLRVGGHTTMSPLAIAQLTHPGRFFWA